MGACASELDEEQEQALAAQQRRTMAIQAKLRQHRDADRAINKLLLLGAGESGKSTLFKQMIMLYGDRKDLASFEERMAFVEVVHQNVVCNAKRLAKESYRFGEPTTEAGRAARTMIHNQIQDTAQVKGVVLQLIKTLWEDEGIQRCYANRSQYQLSDSAAYFFSRLDQIAADDYVPADDDILRIRVRTTGIVEHSFMIEDNPFRMYDVGGQRNERKKWIHCFERVTAVMFVAAISEFDQVLYEDDHTNRMTEALSLFHEISNSEWFTTTAMILFLNKSDLFLEKIKTKDITDSACEDLRMFEGNCRDFAETTDFLDWVFKSKNPDKDVYSHVTCATDTANVKYVFEDVREVIIQRSLEEAGLS